MFRTASWTAGKTMCAFHQGNFPLLRMTDCVGHDPEPKIAVSPELVVRHGHGQST
jgi:hypothetical protein